MDISSMHHPPLYVSCGLLILFALPLLSLPLLVGRPRMWFWTTAAPVMLVLLPLLIGTALTFTALMNAFQGMARSGSGGFAAVAAGFYEAIVCVIYGAAASAVMALTGFIRALRHPDGQTAPNGTAAVTALVAAGLALTAGAILLPMALPGTPVAEWMPIVQPVPWAKWLSRVVLVLAIAMLIALRARTPGAEIAWRWHARTLGAAFAACVILGMVAWIVSRRMLQIAMHGL
jgi:hypothetical protein